MSIRNKKKNKPQNNNVLKQEDLTVSKSNKLLNLTLIYSFKLFYLCLFGTIVAAIFSSKENLPDIFGIGINVTVFFGFIAAMSGIVKMVKISKELK